ncbi:regulatory protein RecX [Sungkyunkwania multivorans]|uniref:Regulatory protein RecX n=1 Tax=Sungkyunkwania multivorans TaxID=1173618 RepID=A0ABW3D2F1_9FLAO
MVNTRKSYTVSEAQKKLEHYCAYQERCHQEVIDKLQRLNMIPEAIDVIVSNLIHNNYLNEERFAKSFARGKFSQKGWGRNRIVRELKLRNVSKFNINSALSEISEEDYLLKINELCDKRLKSLKETNIYKRRKKLTDYLLYRGWESYLVYEKVREFIP